jgi:hypothetical protein
MLAAVLLSAGAATLAFEITKQEVAHQRSAAAEPIGRAILAKHLQDLGGVIALP